MTEARQLCRSLLPACILIDTEETQEFEELLEPSDGLNSKISGLLPNIDSDPPNLQVNLVSHAPRNEFEVLESIILQIQIKVLRPSNVWSKSCRTRRRQSFLRIA